MQIRLRFVFPALLFAAGLLQVWAQDQGDQPANQRSADEPVLTINKGDVKIERQPETPDQAQILEAILSLQADLEVLELAEMGSETRVDAAAGGCEILLGENTNFRVKAVGPEETVVTILDIELELDRGTVIETAYGSLIIDLIRGNYKARPDPDALFRAARGVVQAAKASGDAKAIAAATASFQAIASANAAKAATAAAAALAKIADAIAKGEPSSGAQHDLARALRDLGGAKAALSEAKDVAGVAAIADVIAAATKALTAAETVDDESASKTDREAAAQAVAKALGDLAQAATALGDPVLSGAAANSAIQAAISQLGGASAAEMLRQVEASGKAEIKFLGPNNELLSIDLTSASQIQMTLSEDGQLKLEVLGAGVIEIKDQAGNVVKTITSGAGPSGASSSTDEQQGEQGEQSAQGEQGGNDVVLELPPTGTVVGSFPVSAGSP
jgi:hypothetical protein